MAIDTASDSCATLLTRRLLRYSCDNGPEAHAAWAELADVPHDVSDEVCAELATKFASGNIAACAVFGNWTEPRFFASGHAKLIAGLETGSEKTSSMRTFIEQVRRMPVRRPEIEQASLLRRVLTCYLRPWVVMLVWIPLLVALILVVLPPSETMRIIGLASIACLLGGVVAIESRLRQCPFCRRSLALFEVAFRHLGSHQLDVRVTTPQGRSDLVQRTVHSYAPKWRCVHCQRRPGVAS